MDQDNQQAFENLQIKSEPQYQSIQSFQENNKFDINYIQQISIDKIKHQTPDQTIFKKDRNNDIIYNVIIDDIDQETQKQNQNEQFKLFNVYKSKQSNLDLFYNDDLKKVMIRKEDLSQDNLFQKEHEILKTLNGQEITFDIISTTNNKIEQIAGYTDLLNLKQKTNSREEYLGLQFLILLNKLNKMHELGIAHSDIKPKNIVVSIDSEPFFIDFGGSIYLQDYQNYLEFHTPSFNLDIFLSDIKNNRVKYQFRNQEEVKLCDKTQLALTFLYLLCDDHIQLELFKNKQFYEVLFKLFESKNKNTQIILSMINNILNQADPRIEIVNSQQQQIFNINYRKINNELANQNDIYFKEEDGWKIKQINKFSIKIIYLLDKLQYKFEMDPQFMIINPQPEMKEYQYICQKYQIKKYHSELINFKSLEFNDQYNLCEYIKKMPNQIYNILFEKKKDYSVLFKVIDFVQYTESLELNFKFDQELLNNFLMILKKKIPNFYIKIFKLSSKKIVCQISKVTSSLLQSINVQFEFDNPKQDLLFYIEKFQSLKINYNTQQLKLNFYCSFWEDKEIFNKIQELSQYLIQIVKLKENYINFSIYIQINRNIDFNHQFLNKLLYFQTNNNTEINHTDKQVSNVKEIDNLLKKTKREKIFKDNAIFQQIYKIQRQIGIDQITQLLQSTNKIQVPHQKLIFKFQNFLFFELQLWTKFKQIIEGNKNKQIEIILINCQFNKYIIQFFKIIKMINFPVKFNFYDEFKSSNEQIKFPNNTQYQIGFENNQQITNEQRLVIQFYKKIAQQSKSEYFNSEWKFEKGFLNQEQEYKYMKLDGFQENFDYKIPFQKFQIQGLNLNFSDELKINQINKMVNIKNNKIDILQVINQINNQIYYNMIQIKFEQNWLSFFATPCDQDNHDQSLDFDPSKRISNLLIINYDCDCNEKDIKNLFQQLLLGILNNSHKIQLRNQRVIEMQLSIYQQKSYSSYLIKQRLFIDNEETSKDIKIKMSQNKNIFLQSLKLKTIRLEFSPLFYDDQQKLQNKSYKIKKSILNGQIMDDLKNFQEKYFVYSELSSLTLNYSQSEVCFILNQWKIGDQAFKQFFYGVEKLFPHRNKCYELNQCDLTIKTLYIINKSLIEFQEEKIIRFQLKNNDLHFLHFLYFIKKVISDNSVDNFQFEIFTEDEKQQQIIKKFFEDIFKIEIQYKTLILQFKQQSSPRKPKIYFIIEVKLLNSDILYALSKLNCHFNLKELQLSQKNQINYLSKYISDGKELYIFLLFLANLTVQYWNEYQIDHQPSFPDLLCIDEIKQQLTEINNNEIDDD